MTITRREFLAAGLGTVVTATVVRADEEKKPARASLAREVGITTGSFSRQLQANPQRFQLPGLIKVIRDELQMRVVDVYTPSLASFEPKYLDEVRKAADDAGCLLTNLKLNQPGLDPGSRDKDLREKSLAEYKRSIDAAVRLGMRWVRPLPGPNRPDRELLVAGYRELADYAAERGVQLLVENFGWMQGDPKALVELLDAVGKNIAASPDTGNWTTNDVRYDGLARAFPRAVTCDFKARDLGPNGEHDAYNLKKCFQIGWDAGFRGPWCIEHGHADAQTLFRELRNLRDNLRQWIAAQGDAK